jgi:hypothetical protein
VEHRQRSQERHHRTRDGAAGPLTGLAGYEHDSNAGHSDRNQVAPEAEQQLGAVAHGSTKRPGQPEETEGDEDSRDDEGDPPNVIGLTT